MSRVNVTLYNKEGTTQIGLNPATVADQVEIPAADGSPSDVAAEIVKLREGLGAAVDGGITAGAQPNQNAFASVKVGDSTIAADSTGDTLTLEAGNGITLKADTANDKVTVEETYIDSCMVNSLDAVPVNLRNGGLIILRG